MLEGGHKYAKNRLAMGATIVGDAAKSGRSTHLLVIMRVSLLQKISLHNLTNMAQFKKGES